MLSLGTGTVGRSDDRTPHFRHIFRDGFLRRGFDAWMSTLDTERDWLRLKQQEGNNEYHRLNITLGEAPNRIDAVEAMDDYRNMVILQPGSARRAREAAAMLLASRFFFVITSLPNAPAGSFWCHGVVRCRGSARDVVRALESLFPEGLHFASDSGVLSNFEGQAEICQCGLYSHPVSFQASHVGYPVNLYLQTSLTKRWKISGFPATLASIANRQGLWAAFGQGCHDSLCRLPCSGCENNIGSGPVRGKRRQMDQEYPRNTIHKRLRVA